MRAMKKDPNPDRLLRRTARPRGDVRPPGACLDAGTIAAWAEGSLTGAERDAAEAHAADCERCLAVVAAMARTAPPPVAARPSWSPFRWLVPLTTAAVAVTAWVIVREPAPAPPRAPAAAVDAIEPAAPRPPAEADERAAAPRRQQAEPPARKAEQPAATPTSKDRREAKPSAETLARDALAQPPPPAAPAPAPSAARETVAQPQAMARFAAATVLIPSPDSTVQWRISGIAVERSADAGRTWQAQPTGTTVELAAGSSPAPSVCWIVGRAGTVLLSTDGATWRRLASPDPAADLAAVAALDDRTATVTTADGRSYRTSDAGRTWTLQEDSARPF